MSLREAAEKALEALEYAARCAAMVECSNAAEALRTALAEADEPAEMQDIGSEWRPCVKLPVTVHVRAQRPGESHVSTREGITPVKPDDLIMRGVAGEEYPISRALFERTYVVGDATLAEADDRKCTCHPDDNPPQPCPKQFALGECRQAAALAEAKEPVAWRVRAVNTFGSRGPWRIYHQSAKPGVNHPECCDFQPLYLHPPRREPLAEEAIRQCYEQSGHYQSLRPQNSFAVFAFARAVERAHGIGTDE